MSRLRVTGDTIEEIKEQLNRILKRVQEELDTARGYSGDVDMSARMVHKDDIIFNDPTKGLVLLDDGTPQTYWRIWVDSNGSLATESMDPGLRD